MKERPILFKGEMIRAIQSGQKTQTRRVVKNVLNNNRLQLNREQMHVLDPRLPCPYGQPGDRLWVRETWQGPLWDEDGPFPENGYTPEYCEYRADGGKAPWFVDADGNEHNCWRPSIHMPRWACRIVLEIVSVRVERLNDISRGDAMDEGCPFPNMAHGDDPRQWFSGLWESINGPESWQANPWVWVVEFKRVQQ